MENVFGYFLAIGAGTSFGLSLGIVPALLVWRFMNRKGGNHAITKITKTRS